MSITVRTIIRGLAYLVTFFFGTNFIGLLGLTFKLIIDPESGEEEVKVVEKEEKKKLPKIKLTSDPEEVRKAFDSVFPSDRFEESEK